MQNSKTEALGLWTLYVKQVVASRNLTESDRDQICFLWDQGPEAQPLLAETGVELNSLLEKS